MTTKTKADEAEPAPAGVEALDLDKATLEALRVAILDEHQLPLAGRIALAMSEAGTVTKSGTNTEQNYRFASAEAILAAVRGPLLSRGILLLPRRLNLVEDEIQSRGGSKGTRVKLDLAFKFTDGAEELEAEWTGEGQDYGDKAYGKAYTNAVKTFVRVAWLLPTEHDDPERSDPGERVAAQQRPAAPAWAAFLEADEAKAEAIGYMHRIIYAADPDTATRKVATATLAQWAKAAGGGVPIVVANTLKALGLMFPEPPAPDPAAATDADRQAVAGEEPQAPPEVEQAPEPGPTVEEQAQAARAAREAAEEPPVDVPLDAQPSMFPEPPEGFTHWPTTQAYIDARNIGGLGAKAKADALRRAGCICRDPLGDAKDAADACPFADHGIPF